MIAPSAPALSRERFALDPALTYLNHAAVGVLPVVTRDAVIDAVSAHARAGVLGMWPVERALDDARARVAGLIGAQAADVAFLRSTSDGGNVVARGLDWKAGDEIILPDDEFGSNALPWLALREYGVIIRFVERKRQRLIPEVLASMISNRTKLVAVSWVSFVDGYRHDLQALGEIAHAHDALFCVDAIQGLGAFPLDAPALGIDALYAGGAKWLLALQGVSFLYVSPRLRERLRVRWPGWKALADMWDFLNYEQPLAPTAARYEAGTQNFLGALSLERSIGVLQEAGIERIGEHVLALTEHLSASLRKAGATMLSERSPGTSSGIVTFAVPSIDSIAAGKALQERGFVTTYRKNGIRVSPHGYNTHDEIDAFAETLHELVNHRRAG